MRGLGDIGSRAEQIDCSVHCQWRALEFKTPTKIFSIVFGIDDDLQGFQAISAFERGLERRDKRTDDLGELVAPDPIDGQLLPLKFYKPFHAATIACGWAVSQYG